MFYVQDCLILRASVIWPEWFWNLENWQFYAAASSMFWEDAITFIELLNMGLLQFKLTLKLTSFCLLEPISCTNFNQSLLITLALRFWVMGQWLISLLQKHHPGWYHMSLFCYRVQPLRSVSIAALYSVLRFSVKRQNLATTLCGLREYSLRLFLKLNLN